MGSNNQIFDTNTKATQRASLLETQLRGLARREHVQGAALLHAAASTAGAGTGSCRRLGLTTGGAPGRSSSSSTTARRRLGRGRGRLTLPERQLAADRTALCRLLHFADRDEVRALLGELALSSWPLPRVVRLLDSGVVFPHDLDQVPPLLLAAVTRKGGLMNVGQFVMRGGRGGLIVYLRELDTTMRSGLCSNLHGS